MSDSAQYAAFGRALDLHLERQKAQDPVRIPGLEALGHSSHGGAPVTGSVVHDPIELERMALEQAPHVLSSSTSIDA